MNQLIETIRQSQLLSAIVALIILGLLALLYAYKKVQEAQKGSDSAALAAALKLRKRVLVGLVVGSGVGVALYIKDEKKGRGFAPQLIPELVPQ